jgi:ATP-dependent DNA helicase RecQ
VREISKREEKQAKVIEILEKTPWCGIIYCSSRKSVKEVYDYLIWKNIATWIYTGEMNAEDREREQNNFMNWKYKVIVATNAFWMWIDKKDIRFVIHYNLPWSIENYYQEVGRAGRDEKNSYWVVLASYHDKKIQEFFIENSYPSREEILKFYNYLYKDFKVWVWKWTKILKTQETMSNESWIWSPERVSSIIRVLEKYNILKRWVDDFDIPDDFRWKWITLLQDKKLAWKLEIDWSHQEALKEEAYFKLEQIKKLLFYPSCRKKFILNYFWDEEDLAKIWDSCGACDYCIEKKKLANEEIDDFVKTSVFAIVLEIVKKFDTKFWVQTITRFLRGSWDKKLIEWKMDKYKEFWILSDLTSELIQAIIEALISLDYLYKTSWQYPVLWITETGRIAIVKDFLLKDDNRELQQFIKMRLWNKLKTKAAEKPVLARKKNVKDSTLNETLTIFRQW